VNDLSWLIVACTLVLIAGLSYVAWVIQDVAERLAARITTELHHHSTTAQTPDKEPLA
jgi:hypothetical protein